VIRVVVAEDSPTARALLCAVLGTDPDITIVGEAVNGEEAVALTGTLKPDIVTLDLNMPVMDGIAATRAIMASHPTPIVLLTGSSVEQDIASSFDALGAGALAILDKPAGLGSDDLELRWAQLVQTIKALADVRVVRQRPLSPSRRKTPAVPHPPKGHLRPQIIAIAASAGGPTAVRDTLRAFPRSIDLPVLVVQHIAAEFAGGFADWLDGAIGTARRAVLATNGAALEPRTVYVAPSDRHLAVARERIALLNTPPVGGFRPSATVLFESIAMEYGNAGLGVILSGMGSDGVEGLRALRDAGGIVVAQDAASAAVNGMPAAAVQRGVVTVSLDPVGIGEYIAECLN
jgi:two-component system chemotaxis response regulator CheB